MRFVPLCAVPVLLATVLAAPAAAQTTFPAGAYAVTLSPSEIPLRSRLTGVWRIRFGADGQFDVSKDGRGGLAGHYQVSGDTLTLADGTKSLAAPDADSVGRYRWWRDSAGIMLALIGDHEEARSIVLTAGPLTPVATRPSRSARATPRGRR